MWMSLCDEEVEPLMNVIAFEKAEGGKLSSTCAVGARIGEQDREPVRKQELGVSGHADAVVAESVEEDCCVAVAAVRADRPGTESDGV